MKVSVMVLFVVAIMALVVWSFAIYGFWRFIDG